MVKIEVPKKKGEGKVERSCKGKDKVGCILEVAEERANQIMKDRMTRDLKDAVFYAWEYDLDDVRRHLEHTSQILKRPREVAREYEETGEREVWKNLLEYIVHEKVEINVLGKEGYEPCEVDWPEKREECVKKRSGVLEKCHDYNWAHMKANKAEKLVYMDER